MPDLLFLTQSGDTLPSVRFRVLPMVEQARAAGLNASRRRIPKTLAGRIPFYLFLPHTSVIVVQKRLLKPWEMGLLRRKSDLLVFDFDDALWTSHPNVPPGPARRAREKRDSARLEAVCRAADMVIAGNEYLAAKVRPWSRRVDILPTPLDTEAYVPAPAAKNAADPETVDPKIAVGPKMTVGWMGTSCNLFFLPEVMEAMRPFIDLVRPLVVSDGKCTLVRELGGECVVWTPEGEIARLQSMDVGLMPLTDDDYTRGKCGFKLLQYMACGAVPVASPVGMNADIVEHGVNGLLAATPDEFASAVQRLAADPDLRRSMAAQARKTVVERFSLPAAWERLREMLGLD